MPPFVPRKRHRSPSPAPTPLSKGEKPAAKRAKPTLSDAIDSPEGRQNRRSENKKLLDELNNDDDESLSEPDSDDFEDVLPAPKRQKKSAAEDEDEDDDDDGMDWEDAMPAGPLTADQPDREIGDVSFSIKEDGSYVDPGVAIPGVSGKKGPSKRERQVRIQTHCLHVQSLLWHNTVRNSWLNDKEVQKTLVDGLSEGVKREVTRWREAMGTLSKQELEDKKRATATKSNKGKRGGKGKEKATGRDWNYEAEHAEQGVPNLSAGDPLLRLLKVLTAYWRKRFTITVPGLRKQGYMPLRRLRDEVKDWEKNKNDFESHGERIEDLKHFCKLAEACEGSRDVGAQLFCALLRGLGIETRLVANLQPSGFGWSKGEEADAKKPKKDDKSTGGMSESEDDVKELRPKTNAAQKPRKPAINAEEPTRVSARSKKAEIINLDSDSPLSSAPPDDDFGEASDQDDDDLSVVDVTPATPKKKPNKKYDRDLAFPVFWVEACSPVTNKYIPIDPIVLSTIASNDELLQTFEPRGKKAEKSKQVMCYTIAFSADGTAKDVTVRYLKKHQLPGKTKGVRMPIEKVPVYNRKGKVKNYEEYDWFRTVMSLYDRPEKKRTAADDLEDQTDLKPFKPAQEDKEVEKESLQWYKQSAEFVLELHLRREEAIIPGAKPVKTFTAGKGDKAKEHPVYRRKDVVACKTVESWHKEGRAIKIGEQPMKLVPMRAVTLVRKREMEDAQRETGEKLKQGLYSIDQTDWIIPPPIQDGVIPKNAFGNMDVYVPTMVPRGAVHLPLKGSAKLCRKLEIDYAEACTGFEFGKQRAVPVLTGVVVAEEHEMLVRDAWRAEQAEQKRKEDTKRTGVAFHWWRKMLLGLRVIERMRIEYQEVGGDKEEINPFMKKALRESRAGPTSQAQEADNEEVEGGGFFLSGHGEEEVPQNSLMHQAEMEVDEEDTGGGFLVEDGADQNGGGFLVHGEAEKPAKGYAPITPVSLQSLHKAKDDADAANGSDSDVFEVARKPAAPGKRNARKQPKRTVDDDDESSLSEPPSDNDKEEEANENESSDSEEVIAPTRKRNLSPQVVVSPRSKSTRRTSTRVQSKAGKKKATPLRSQYFTSSEDRHDGEERSAEAEVVQPRRMIAKTRRKA
jgi:xeroderma pigmentosum group C-complementing protein